MKAHCVRLHASRISVLKWLAVVTPLPTILRERAKGAKEVKGRSLFTSFAPFALSLKGERWEQNAVLQLWDDSWTIDASSCRARHKLDARMVVDLTRSKHFVIAQMIRPAYAFLPRMTGCIVR